MALSLKQWSLSRKIVLGMLVIYALFAVASVSTYEILHRWIVPHRLATFVIAPHPPPRGR